MTEIAERRYADKVAVVTGAASGIGLATARRLAAEGARVASAIAWLGSDDAAFVQGAMLRVDGGRLDRL